jgi:hypothetical protein
MVELVVVVLLLAACGASQPNGVSSPPASGEDLPIFPGAEERKDEIANVYSCKISGEDVVDVQRFYEKEMPKAGWEYLGAGDLRGPETGEMYRLWFSKGEAIATVELRERYHAVYVFIRVE